MHYLSPIRILIESLPRRTRSRVGSGVLSRAVGRGVYEGVGRVRARGVERDSVDRLKDAA